MALKRDGIEQLKADLRANARHYNQGRFGVVTPECWTEACMAGMCLMRRIGIDAFTQRVIHSPVGGIGRFIDDCLLAAAEQLGLELPTDDLSELPLIFADSSYWPDDLRYRYKRAEARHDHAAMAEVACAALDRIDENGFIRDAFEAVQP